MKTIPRPTRLHTGAYCEQRDNRRNWLESTSRRGRLLLEKAQKLDGSRERFARRVTECSVTFEQYSDQDLEKSLHEVRCALAQDGFQAPWVERSFALIRELSARTLGLKHFETQLMGGRVLLEGGVAEMETGEGKTLTATLAAGTMALARVPVHVVTVNDYLTRRDADTMRPLYEKLGLSVGHVVAGLSADERRKAYACDVTYCTNKELAFDYLRDRVTLRNNPSRLQLRLEEFSGKGSRKDRLLLRGLHYAIVDEADSVLIDEARTPLVISASEVSQDLAAVYETAQTLANRLLPEKEFTLDRAAFRVELTPRGAEKLRVLSNSLEGLWTRGKLREQLVTQALAAGQLYTRDQHYVVKNGRVEIVDEYTGRALPGRSWEQGLHQAIEVKEGCSATPRTRPVARTSYQRLFRRYLHLAGMTGTAREVRGELSDVYGLSVVRIRPNRPLARQSLPQQTFSTVAQKWDALVARIAEIHATGRPVLVGTRSVQASEELSRRLKEAGLLHRVLNALQDRKEAETIAHAGEAGQIVVATNMAGRGTDIRLTPAALDAGGLHVIATERHDARRIDRQLFGRCGRQGEPGSHECFASLEDDLVATHAPRLLRGFSKQQGEKHENASGTPLRGPNLRVLFLAAQLAAERKHRRSRGQLLLVDEQVESSLAFAGFGSEES